MRFGVSSKDITPTLPVELVGYGYDLHRMGVDTDSSLQATVLALEDSSGNRAAICGVDLLSVDEQTIGRVRSRVSKQLDDGEQHPPTILINASHTHSGPGAHRLYGVGGYNMEYIDRILVPNLSAAIVDAFNVTDEGAIGIARTPVENLSYNRTAESFHDTRLAVIKVETDQHQMAGLHFPCHPVVYGRNSTVVSSDYPGFARTAMSSKINVDANLWLTGCCGDINPLAIKEGGENTRGDVETLGMTIGHCAVELYDQIKTDSGVLSSCVTSTNLPVNTDFELNPEYETLLYREVRKLPKAQNLDPLRRWLESVAPIVNGNNEETITVPINVVTIGKLAFVGLGAEIYNGTGLALERKHPNLKLVTMMNCNEHHGYIPPREEYERNSYEARHSAFIFGRKPLMPNSEERLHLDASSAIGQATKSF